MKALIALAVVTQLVAACIGQDSTYAYVAPATSTCASVSRLSLYSYTDDSEFNGYGLAKAWHVWFSAFAGRPSDPATIADFVSNTPTKVVIHSDPDVKTPALVRGISCSTGMPLHFCYKDPAGCGLFGRTLSESDLSTSGADHVTIAASPSVDYTGQMLFPRPGLYLLSVLSGSTTFGSTTLSVP